MKRNIILISFLVAFLTLFTLLIKTYKYQYSSDKEEKVLNIEDKLIYNKNEDLILTFAIFPESSVDETYLITVDKNNKIVGFMGLRKLNLELENNYLTRIKKYGEDYLDKNKLNILLDALNKIESAEIKYNYGIGGNNIIIIYNDKIYKTIELHDPIIEEIINIIKKLSPIEIVISGHS